MWETCDDVGVNNLHLVELVLAAVCHQLSCQAPTLTNLRCAARLEQLRQESLTGLKKMVNLLRHMIVKGVDLVDHRTDKACLEWGSELLHSRVFDGLTKCAWASCSFACTRMQLWRKLVIANDHFHPPELLEGSKPLQSCMPPASEEFVESLLAMMVCVSAVKLALGSVIVRTYPLSTTRGPEEVGHARDYLMMTGGGDQVVKDNVYHLVGCAAASVTRHTYKRALSVQKDRRRIERLAAGGNSHEDVVEDEQDNLQQLADLVLVLEDGKECSTEEESSYLLVLWLDTSVGRSLSTTMRVAPTQALVRVQKVLFDFMMKLYYWCTTRYFTPKQCTKHGNGLVAWARGEILASALVEGWWFPVSQASPASFSDASHKYIREAFIVKFINTCDLVFRVHNGCVADHMRVLCTRRMVRVAKATTVYQFERDSGLKSGTLDMLARARDISASEVKELLGAGAEDWARHVRVETRRGVATFVGQMAMVLTTAADLTMLTFREVSGPGPSSRQDAVVEVAFVDPTLQLLQFGSIAAGDLVVHCTMGSLSPRAFKPLDLASDSMASLRNRLPISLTVIPRSVAVMRALTTPDVQADIEAMVDAAAALVADKALADSEAMAIRRQFVVQRRQKKKADEAAADAAAAAVYDGGEEEEEDSRPYGASRGGGSGRGSGRGSGSAVKRVRIGDASVYASIPASLDSDAEDDTALPSASGSVSKKRPLSQGGGGGSGGGSSCGGGGSSGGGGSGGGGSGGGSGGGGSGARMLATPGRHSLSDGGEAAPDSSRQRRQRAV